jgi:membrane-bound lytic murein transglycosylase D
MKQRIPNPKILCCASIFALSLVGCSHNTGKPQTENLADNGSNASNQIVKLKKGHRSKKLGLAKLPDPRSYDNLWDRLFDRFDLPEQSRQEIDRELNWFINHPTYIERVQSRAEPFLYSIVKQLEKQNLPGELALLPVIESAFQPHVVSPAHAAGIWQFIPATGRHYGLKTSHSYDGRRDIYASTRAAIKYLKKMRNDFNGDWLLAIAGYNCGEHAVARAMQRNAARGLPTDFWSLDLPQETRNYVPRLLAVAKLFSESQQYGFELRPIPNKALYKTVKMTEQVDLALAANAADISLDRLLELNPGFKRQQVDLDGSYRLFIPAHKKIVDFKQELARQMTGTQGYPTSDAASNPAPTTTGSVAAAPATRRPLEPIQYAPNLPAEQPAEPLATATEKPLSEQSLVTEQTTQPLAPVEKSIPETGLISAQPARTDHVESPAVKPIAETAMVANSEWSPKPTRRIADAFPSESSLKVADYERIAALAAKETAPAKPLPKLSSASREESTVERRVKAADHEAASRPSNEERTPARAEHKIAQKPREEQPVERRQTETEPSGKKAAYVVQEGDTVYSIARKHEMDVGDLKKMNRLADADDIKWGQNLTVLGKDSVKKTSATRNNASYKQVSAASKYTARDGETLFSISRRFNVTVADLRKWNGIKEDRQFRAGMNITVSREKD